MGRPLAERDSGVNPAPLDDLLERGGERVFQSFALIGEELLEATFPVPPVIAAESSSI